MKRDTTTVERADRLKAQLADQLAALATQRLREWCNEFRRENPDTHGTILFGMGTERVKIGAEYREIDDLNKLPDAIDDIVEITDGYRLACPDDFKW